jgi:hypothetical protein
MAIPVELFRFRVVRNIQAQKAQDQKVIDLVGLPTVPDVPTTKGE